MSISQLGNGPGLWIHPRSFCYSRVWSNCPSPPHSLSAWPNEQLFIFYFLKRVSIYRIRFLWWLFIIIFRHQLIFGGSGNWILDLLFNYQILYQLESTTHWAAFVFSIFDLQNVFLPKAFSKTFVFFLLKVFGSSIKLKKKSIKVKSKYFLSLEFRFKKPFCWN